MRVRKQGRAAVRVEESEARETEVRDVRSGSREGKGRRGGSGMDGGRGERDGTGGTRRWAGRVREGLGAGR